MRNADAAVALERRSTTGEADADAPIRSPERRRDDAAGENGNRERHEQPNKDDDTKGGEGEKPKSRWPLVLLAVVVVLAIIGGIVYWLLNRNLEKTDDAYTEGNAVSIAPKISGYVSERDVDDNTIVHAGDVLLRIDQRDYNTARDQAIANLALARAQQTSAQIDLDITRVRAPSNLRQAEAQLLQARASQSLASRTFSRQHNVDQRATTQISVDQARSQMESQDASVSSAQAQLQVAALVRQTIAASEATLVQRQAQVEQAKASLAQAEINLSYTVIRAPHDGRITKRNFDVGTYAQAGQQIFYIVTPALWVTANFKETQLVRLRPGQKVTITVDSYPDMRLHGHVDSIQDGSGDRFSTFPAENATGNYVKIVRRVPVKIIIDDGFDKNRGLPLGLSVAPTVTVE